MARIVRETRTPGAVAVVEMVQERTPQFLLIVRERLRAGSEEAYHENELQLANACATLKCPHPYLAAVPVAGPREVWWLNAFASREERDGLDAAYAGNKAPDDRDAASR